MPDGDPNKVTREQVLINAGVNNFGYDVWGMENSETGLYGARHPVFAAAYVQDKIEYKDLVVNVGLRYDYINIDNYRWSTRRARICPSTCTAGRSILQGG